MPVGIDKEDFMFGNNWLRVLQRLLPTVLMGVGCATSASSKATASVHSHGEAAAVTTVLRAYEVALNASDVEAVMAVYEEDAVFMAQNRSPAKGRAEIRRAYTEIFDAIKLSIRFEIDEVEVVTPHLAYARTRSMGTTRILANNVEVSEGNQELFILTRSSDGAWKIARYIFSTTMPRAG